MTPIRTLPAGGALFCVFLRISKRVANQTSTDFKAIYLAIYLADFKAIYLAAADDDDDTTVPVVLPVHSGSNNVPRESSLSDVSQLSSSLACFVDFPEHSTMEVPKNILLLMGKTLETSDPLHVNLKP